MLVFLVSDLGEEGHFLGLGFFLFTEELTTSPGGAYEMYLVNVGTRQGLAHSMCSVKGSLWAVRHHREWPCSGSGRDSLDTAAMPCSLQTAPASWGNLSHLALSLSWADTASAAAIASRMKERSEPREAGPARWRREGCPGAA